MINRHIGTLGLASLLLCTSGVLQAQTRQAAQDLLEAAKSVTCNFPLLLTATWKDGVPQGEMKPASLSLKFEEINIDEGSARMVGAFGAFDIIVRLAPGSLHFMQIFRAGPLYTTTIFNQGNGGGRLKAVHTRHEYVEVMLPGFTSRPEQYYGDCLVEK